ncbi:MAG: Hsp20/alpha crystallin family protein [Terriglobales bacterium]
MKSQSAVMERKDEPRLVTRSREEISTRLSELYDVIARKAFDFFESRARSPGHDQEDWFRAESELLHPVPLNVTESNGEYIVRCEVPGFDSKDLEVIVEPLRMAISGKREATKDEENGETICSESRAGRIFKILDLPSIVDPSKVSAALKDGVLIVDLPKVHKAEEVHLEPVAA